MKYKKGDMVKNLYAPDKNEIGVIVRLHEQDVYVVEGFSCGNKVHDGYLYSSFYLGPISIDKYNKEELKKV